MDDLMDVLGSAVSPSKAVPENISMRTMLNAETVPPPTWKMNWQGKTMESGTGAVNNDNPDAFDANIVFEAVKNSQPIPPKPVVNQKQQPFEDIKNKMTDTKPFTETVLNQVSGIGANIIGGWRGLYELAAGHGLDAASNAVQEEQQNRTYQPETAGAKNAVDALSSPYNPMNYFADLGKYSGDKVMDLTGSPALATSTETALTALPLVFLRKGGNVKAPMANDSIANVTKPSISQDIPSNIPNNIKQPATADIQSQQNPVVPKVAFEEAAPIASEGQKLPLSEQSKRASILQRVGLTEARESAVTGDVKSASSDYQQSKLDNSAGNYMRSVLDTERQALENHADNIVKDTGGTIGLDESAKYSRGQGILAPLDALKEYFDNTTKQLYKAADEKASGQPIETPTVHQFIGGDQAEFLGTTEGESLLKGVKARMKSLGMTDDEGNPQPVTVKQAEQLKQYLNNQWQPRTSRLISNMKDAIDEDVTKSAGEDIYQAARKMRFTRAQTLDDPNGIAKIMDSSGPNGINRKVNIEKIPDEITGLPVNQLKHVVDTLNNVPDEIKPQAQQAINEIKSQYANKIQEAGSKRVGQWGARDVNKYLNANAEKLKLVFTPDEMAKIQDLNDAGNILSKDQSYPGAAVQEHNLVKRGAMASIRAGGAAVGTIVGGPIGAAAGDMIGNSMANKFNDKSSLRAAQKRVIKLSDLPK